MRMYDIIAKKRDGGTLTRAEIAFAVNGYVDGSVPDYQMSALLMAIYLRGMTDAETAELTDVMAHSGDTVSYTHLTLWWIFPPFRASKQINTLPAAWGIKPPWLLPPLWQPAA